MGRGYEFAMYLDVQKRRIVTRDNFCHWFSVLVAFIMWENCGCCCCWCWCDRELWIRTENRTNENSMKTNNDESIWANSCVCYFVMPYLPLSIAIASFIELRISLYRIKRNAPTKRRAEKKQTSTEYTAAAASVQIQNSTKYCVRERKRAQSWRQNFWYKRIDKFLHIPNVFGNGNYLWKSHAAIANQARPRRACRITTRWNRKLNLLIISGFASRAQRCFPD